MKTFSEILKSFRENAFSERDKGGRFELLIQRYLKTTSLYEGLFETVWTWHEFPLKSQFGGKDVGIDLVALTYSGDYWAVQCKCYDEEAYINKSDVDSFLSTSSKTFEVDGETVSFARRLWISTTNRWNSVAELTIQNQNPPVSRLNLIDLEEDDVDWEKLENGLFGKDSRVEPFKLKDHQKEAIDKTHEYLKTHDRGKLIMACGTGKTFTSLKIAEKETDNKGLVLFLVPSIALLGQTLRSWSQQASVPISAVCICSDSQVSKQTNKNDDNTMSTVDLALPASTDVDSIVMQLYYIHTKKQEGMTVVFSTYQSIDVISNAQKRLLERTDGKYGEFDLIICDEAHRTTGVKLKDANESSFIKVHNNDFIKGKKRVYMTATPRLYAETTKQKAEESEAVLCSMDDRSLYGDEMYRIGFSEAVAKDLLTDYKVLILAVGDKDITPSLRKVMTNEDGSITVDDASKFVGCINALSKRVLGDEGIIKASDPLPMKRAVAFCSTIKNSKETSYVFTNCKDAYLDDISEEERNKMVDVVAHHVDGSMSATKRDSELMWLKSEPENEMECRMLTNARCLSEGVDVPSLDAVIFVSPKNSQVDVVQSVGRVMRKSEGKKYGYIIIPVVIPEDVEGDEVLEKHANFKVVWTVLNALRAHDDRFNAEVNKIELSKKKPEHILFGGVGYDTSEESDNPSTLKEGESSVEELAVQLSLQFDELQNVFYAKMVNKVGSKRYWELWAKDIAEIAEEHIKRIKALIADEGKHRKAFEQLMKGLKKNINPNLTEQEVIEMLSQHIISQPVFEALFGDFKFSQNNTVSKSMQKMLDLLDDETKTEEENNKLQKFYRYVKTTVGDIKDSVGRQKLIVELYDKFFKVASPKTVEKLGIVYTPIEIVDYIVNSVSDILEKEFHRSITDENIHILDPFTGTGTFITRLLQSGKIAPEDMERKYNHEIHANEIVLLAYYIASINIESVYHSLMMKDGDSYNEFKGICLTDTFQMGEKGDMGSDVFPYNSKRVVEQKSKPITIIMGNPPYSIGQKSSNDNAMNQSYPMLDKAIESTYVELSRANLNKAAYDSYIKAFRWATNRLGDRDGIIAYVSNGSWLDANGLDGFRLCLEREFSSIYVFNLRGNQRTSGELSRREGGKIFGSGSRTPIAITVLVKKVEKSEKCKIYYRDIGDYLSREEKLNIVKEMRSISSPYMNWKVLEPNIYGDWINHRNEQFKTFIPIEPSKKFAKNNKSFFTVNGPAVATGRDSWVYNFSKKSLSENMLSMIDFYNDELERYRTNGDDDISMDSTKISWTTGLKADFKKGISHKYNDDIRTVMYRPFTKQKLYFNKDMVERIGVSPRIFPSEGLENIVICVQGIGSTRDFSAIISNCIPDYQLHFNCQYFPLYWYDDSTSDIADLFNQVLDEDNQMDRFERRDGVSDYILSECRKLYGRAVIKEDIFYYVYGILNSPDYKTTFDVDLKKTLPRIPLVETSEQFYSLSKSGKQLAELHLKYEELEPYSEVEIEGQSSSYKVQKMRFGKLDSKTVDRSTIIYNDTITISNIPLEAYDYCLNGKSAIEWIMERYQVSTDTKSGIVNDPNDWAKEVGDEKYIFNLLLRIITLSVETMKIVNSLPKLKFE